RVIDESKITEGYTCLARGADQIYAHILSRKSLRLVAVIPCTDYESTFGKDDLVRYHAFLRRAHRTIMLPATGPSEAAFYEAGRFVVDSVDIMIAAWNGEPARGLGGTADVVAYAKSRRKPLIHLDSSSLRVVSPFS